MTHRNTYFYLFMLISYVSIIIVFIYINIFTLYVNNSSVYFNSIFIYNNNNYFLLYAIIWLIYINITFIYINIWYYCLLRSYKKWCFFLLFYAFFDVESESEVRFGRSPFFELYKNNVLDRHEIQVIYLVINRLGWVRFRFKIQATCSNVLNLVFYMPI